MRRVLAIAVLCGAAAWGQRPEFDVASLKPVVLDGVDTYTANLGTYRNGVVTLTNTTLAECIRFAYNITADDLLSGPDWIKNKGVRFDILAKTAPETTRSQALLMLRTLLEDRFKLELRREPRVLSYYALTAPNGVGKIAARAGSATRWRKQSGIGAHPPQVDQHAAPGDPDFPFHAHSGAGPDGDSGIVRGHAGVGARQWHAAIDCARPGGSGAGRPLDLRGGTEAARLEAGKAQRTGGRDGSSTRRENPLAN